MKVKTSIYLDEGLLKYLKDIADYNSRSLNQVINMILNQYKNDDENIQED